MQQSVLKEVQQGGLAKIMGFEYPATITLGLRSHVSVDLLKPIEALERQGISVVSTNRGGEATLHSPGQLVIYPILPLNDWKLGVRDYVNLLTETTALWLSRYGVESEARRDLPGVFTQRGKIAFVGVAVRQGVSFHGLSINVANDLRLFSLIRACGVPHLALDSIYPYPQPVELESPFQEWCSVFVQRLSGSGLNGLLKGPSI